MTKFAAILGWSTITYGSALVLLHVTAPAALAVLAGAAIACCVVGSHEARERRAREQVARIIERSRNR